MIATAASPTVPVTTDVASQARVSIVITCYNQGRFLAEAVQSALNQTAGNIEILVVDDGSTDDTVSVAGRFPAVRCIRQSNQGLAAARNAGLSAAVGEFICFLDADDMLLPEAIEAGCATFHEHPECAFVYGDSCDVDASGQVISPRRGYRALGNHYRSLLEGNFIGMHATVLYRRRILRSLGGFDTRLRRCEDYEAYLRIARQHSVREHSNLTAYYRQHDQNMSRDYASILNSAVSVIRMQTPFIRGEAALRKAARKGITGWRDYYGELLLDDAKGCFEATGLNAHTIGKIWQSLTHCPRKLASRLVRAAVRCLRRSKPVSQVKFGELRRLSPFSRNFGFEFGLPVDRYYIERFLESHAGQIRGAVLEIGDATYTTRFGGDRVTSSDVLHVSPAIPGVTITADLTMANQIPSNCFDCVILTQTLHFIFDVRAAIRTVWRLLKPGGCVLATVPCISQICRDQPDRDSDTWRFTPSSAGRLFHECFGTGVVQILAYGNILAATAFLFGLPSSELCSSELDANDADYPLVVCIKATKARQTS
jgi:glycosyltransferase involved in cell wall biosynthesis